MGDPSSSVGDFDSAVTGASAALVDVLLGALAAPDGRIHAEDAISAAAAVVGERCIDAAGEFNPRRHHFTPGAHVLSERVNELISGNQSMLERAPATSVVGVLRDRLVATGYRADEFPDLKRVFEGFAARIGEAHEWGRVPLSVPLDNKPHLMPLMVAFETRGAVERALSMPRGNEANSLAASTLALADILGKVKDVIDHRVALLLAIETVNGMSKTAPMTIAASRLPAHAAPPAASAGSSPAKRPASWRRFLPWGG